MNQAPKKLYPHPFSKGYWIDAASELKSVRMLVITALLIALRIALKPLAIPLGPQLSIQTAMLATALGAMIYGPVVAVPAAIISDTIGFIIWPNGEYFLPFVLTEIASTMAYALCLYRAKPTVGRVMLSRFLICFFVNLVLQTGIIAWQYDFLGNPEKAKDQILGMFAVVRVLKNLCMFPIETVVLTLFLRLLMPVIQRAKLTSAGGEQLRFSAKRIVALVLLTVIGAGTATGYLVYLYGPEGGRSRSADYSTEQRVEKNKAMANYVLEQTDEWDDETVFCVVDSAYRGVFDQTADLTVSVYILNPENFAAGQAAEAENDKTYTYDTLWAYSKSGPSKDVYKSLEKVASFTVTEDEKTGSYENFILKKTE